MVYLYWLKTLETRFQLKLHLMPEQNVPKESVCSYVTPFVVAIDAFFRLLNSHEKKIGFIDSFGIVFNFEEPMNMVTENKLNKLSKKFCAYSAAAGAAATAGLAGDAQAAPVIYDTEASPIQVHSSFNTLPNGQNQAAIDPTALGASATSATTTASRSPMNRESWSAPPPFPPCRFIFGMIRTTRNTLMPISAVIPTSGAMVTLS